MAEMVSLLAVIGCEPRQAWKGAAAATDSGAGAGLAGSATLCEVVAMSYQVLARKWRPRSFAEMVGQEQARQALTNALDSDRLHHAYLFTGTRGVGKTTIARIIAKCLNCETGITSQPCGRCSVCTEIDEGRFLDLIEVDAASRTGVDDTRELLENVQYSPAKGRFKVYLIDEVHMFSKHSFNALLKTLEEPPPYVKFLLATTDPQKIPPTILSRCLQFHLRPISTENITGQIERILQAEAIESETAAIREIARAAKGSMRDALSILDQGIAFGGGKLVGEDLRKMLGVVGKDQIEALIRALIERDGAQLMSVVEQLALQSADFGSILEDLLAYLHNLAILKAVPEAVPFDAEDESQNLAELAAQLQEEEIQLYYQIALTGRKDLPYAADPRSGLEMTLLRMLAFRPVDTESDQDSTRNAAPAPANKKPPINKSAFNPAPSPGSASPPTLSSPTAESRPGVDPESPPVSVEIIHSIEEPAAALMPPLVTMETPGSDVPFMQREELPSAAPEPSVGAPEKLNQPWEEVVRHLHVSGRSRELVHNAALQQRLGNHFYFVVEETKKTLLNQSVETKLAEAMSEWFGQEVKVSFSVDSHQQNTPADNLREQEEQRRREAIIALREDPLVKEFQRVFDAELDEQSVKPLGSNEL